MLKESGFFSPDAINVKGKKVSPLEFTSQLLFNEWKLGVEEEEFTVMRVTVKGTNDQNESVTVQYDLYDAYDADTKTSSMARCTGYTATAAVNMVIDGLFDKKGVYPPELVGNSEACFEFILNYLADRGVRYTKKQV